MRCSNGFMGNKAPPPQHNTHTHRMTDTTESVTFPQLRWRIVVISSVFLPLFESESCKVLILRGFSIECYKFDVECYILCVL